ncbi:MAG: 2Fe-2S iron-sulfur cluster binding domain-containing protein [Myxococcales bacterium]|nr:2Fe-2S iron-sulfur cluster binding domain-containing protein [Myxococcales bacterium]
MIRLRLSDRVWELRPGDRLIDLADDEPEFGVPFSCRSANCGTCRVEVVRGAEAFEAATDDERETLEAFGDGPEVRLCCQLRVVTELDSQAGEVELTPMDP